MKKTILRVAVMALLFAGCSDDNNLEQEQAKVDMSDFYLYTDATEDGTNARVVNGKNCSSMTILNRQLNDNPGLYESMYEVELHSRQFMANARPPGGNGGGNGNGNGGGGNGGGDGDGGGGDPVDDGLGTLNIPVYIYVIYSNSSQNISDAQINSQMAVLNADFNDTNFNDVRAEFQGLGADVDINFMTPVVDRQFNSTSSWGTNNAVKSVYPAQPGYLTMWVANIGGGILGYAQFPGGNASTDGVVMSPQYFGTTGTAQAPFDGGRTTTHEVGHWMNLRHIWGDGRCRQDDFVSDTPSSDAPNYGCDLGERSCRTTDMVENYMDYSDDDCMGLFTEGQKARMRAVFAPGGARASLVGN
ncbi:zinc metalloprotease [uncultured Winogradskyella sp.]|uniref:zinc metalloprotease n=1 Tax=uncultured Winogradskyella sp. TaxID=395353 RepID=UPI00260D2064|nr:zinc metalloprotease [uncultured Winogradskyella sp.]